MRPASRCALRPPRCRGTCQSSAKARAILRRTQASYDALRNYSPLRCELRPVTKRCCWPASWAGAGFRAVFRLGRNEGPLPGACFPSVGGTSLQGRRGNEAIGGASTSTQHPATSSLMARSSAKQPPRRPRSGSQPYADPRASLLVLMWEATGRSHTPSTESRRQGRHRAAASVVRAGSGASS